MGTRTSFLRYRPGDTETLTITPAWLTVTSGAARGGPQVFTRGDLEVPVVAWIRCKRTWNVQVGDVLRCTSGSSTGRLFVVRQISPEQQTQLLACGELSSIIPDDFETGIVEAWWTAEKTFTPTAGGGALVVELPAESLAGAGSFLYQTVAGNFDVWVSLTCPTGTVGNEYFLLLGLRFVSSGVYVGLRSKTGVTEALRIDESGGVDSLSTTGILGTYVRLRRAGENILAYYATTADAPTESDWILIVPASAVKGDGSAFVGVGGHRVGASDTGSIEFVRNWDPA